MVLFFRKKLHCKCAKYVSTQTSSEFTQDMSGQKGEDARVGDIPCLQQDTTLPPCYFAYKLLVKMNHSN
jgi:hypothetical protein